MTMFRLWLTLILSVSLLTLSGLPTVADAALPDAVKQDFSQIDGYVIMPVNGEYLVDIDASKGAHRGDLLSITQPGEKIVHPITGEVIGSLNKTLAVLSITQIKTGYSYARVVSGTASLDKGTPVKRFSGLSASFSGQGPAAATLYQELTAALPALDWQGQTNQATGAKPAATDILFTLTGTLLEVRNASGQLLRSYPLEISVGKTNPQVPTQRLLTPAPLVEAAVSWQKAQPATEGFSFDADKTGAKPIGSLNSNTLMSDFISTADGLLLATTDGATVHVFHVSDRLQPAAEYKFPARKVHALSWWQPTPNALYLTVSASDESFPTSSTTTETYPQSSIFQFSADTLTPISDKLAYFLGSFDRDGDGRRETLLGQDLDLDIFYGRVVQLHLKDLDIQSSAPDFDLPRPFPVQGSLFADLTGDGKPETITLARGLLTIYSGKNTLYQSRKEMGGSISQLTYDTNPGQIDALFTSASFEITPIAADIDGDGQLELVAISSDHPTIISPFHNDISETWLSVFKYRDGRFIKGTFGAKFNHPLQGLFALKTQLFLMSSGLTGKDDDNSISQVETIPLRNVN